MAVLDTSYLIALDQKDKRCRAIEDWLDETNQPRLIAAASWVEYLTGFHGKTLQAKTNFLEQNTEFIAMDRSVADAAAVLRRVLLATGRPLSWQDLHVAATALDLNEPLVTFDDDFTGIPGLEVIRP